MTFETIDYDVDGHTATITLNRPEALNALSPHMITELRAAYDEAENDDKVWLSSSPAPVARSAPAPTSRRFPKTARSINERPYLSTYDQWEAPQEGTPPFRTMAKPVVVAVNGSAAAQAWTGSPPATSSSPPSRRRSSIRTSASAWSPDVRWCGLARVLPRIVALRMALMGKHERMSAQRAYELGMITEIVEHDRLLERAHEIADIVNSNAPLAVRGTRLAIIKGLDMPLHEAEMLAETFRERVTAHRGRTRGPAGHSSRSARPIWQCR